LSHNNHDSVKVTLLIEPHYLPSIAFFVYALRYDSIQIEQYANFQRSSYANRTYIANFQRSSYANRTYIAGANGQQRLSIPLKGGSRQKCILKDIKMDFTENWLKEHWFAIQSAYARAAFFEYYETEIKAFFENPTQLLLEWNTNWLKWLCAQLDWSASVSLTNEYFTKEDLGNDVFDMRHTIKPNSFDVSQLESLKYYQLFKEKNGFQYNLSVLDMLMSVGPEALGLLKGVAL